MGSEPARKKRKTIRDDGHTDNLEDSEPRSTNTAMLTNSNLAKSIHKSSSLRRSISPPVLRRRNDSSSSTSAVHDTIYAPHSTPKENSNLTRSPVQLSQVEGLSSSNNVDTVMLRDILGDPLISDCWVFNYLFDVDFLM